MNLCKILGLRHFTDIEINRVSFGCPDGVQFMCVRALVMYDQLRENLGFRLDPTCAYRTLEYDISKGRSGNSDHCAGRAMDFKITDLAQALRIVVEASKLGFNSFGVNLKDGFVHIGMKPDVNLVTWNYK